MNKISTVLSIAAVSLAVATAAPANAAQGGWDRSGNPHAWIKIGRAEMNQAGNYPQRNCWSALHNGEGGQNPYIACDNLVSALQAEQTERPNANGYWAEWYYNTNKGNAGTW